MISMSTTMIEAVEARDAMERALMQGGKCTVEVGSRKRTLVEHGFRLPSALDNRPLRFSEFEQLVGQTIYVSATPSDYELERTGGRFGLVSLCIGGGQGIASIFERVT